MIQLIRVRTATAIKIQFRGAKRAKRERELLDFPNSNDFSWKSSRWKPAKAQLKIESQGKCAYCEARTSTVAHGDVEHFRPKSVYWWLAYCYDNWLYSCQICNQTFKSNIFPIDGTPLSELDVPKDASEEELQKLAGTLAPDPLNKAAVDAFFREAKRERAHLTDPYAMDPEKLLGWREDLDNREVRVVAGKNSAAARRALKGAEVVVGLNREQLTRARWLRLSTLRTLRDAFEAFEEAFGSTDQRTIGVRDGIRDMMHSGGEFSGMTRFFVQSEWSLDISVPEAITG